MKFTPLAFIAAFVSSYATAQIVENPSGGPHINLSCEQTDKSGFSWTQVTIRGENGSIITYRDDGTAFAENLRCERSACASAEPEFEGDRVTIRTATIVHDVENRFVLIQSFYSNKPSVGLPTVFWTNTREMICVRQ